MVIAHNMTAANANRMLGLTSSCIAKSSEKLASGYRINRAADDAAGLAISEKMRAQIRGLNRASKNAMDGISLIQTAEGALNEVHAMLHRMNELATQGANDTNTDVDRRQIQKEIDQLKSEIDDVSNKTNFNTKQVLQGNNTRDTNGTNGANLPGEEGKLSYYTAKDNLNGVFGTGNDVDPETGRIEIRLDTSIETANNKFMIDFIGLGLGIVNQDFVDRSNNTMVDFMGLQTYTSPDGTTGNISAIVSVTPDDPTKPSLSVWDIMDYLHRADAESKAQGFPPLGLDGYVEGFDGFTDRIKQDWGAEVKSATITGGVGNRRLEVETWSDVNDPLKLMLQVGSLSGQGIEISIEHMNARRLGITGCRVTDFEKSGKAMESIQNAIDIVSSVRSDLGAQQNRLEHTIANLDNTAENIAASESRLRDTDMASQMVEYTKSKLLEQVGQAILAQANTSTQGALSLLG